MKNKKIILTGGGSAGHVTPNIALIPHLRKAGYDIAYIGGKNGIEKEIIGRTDLKYYSISTGKLRRYFHVKNFTDPFRVLKGIGDSLGVLRKEKPDIIFSKGGFVVVPVVMAAKILGIPVVSHESDMTPGLANKIAAPFVKKICVTFPEAKKWFKEDRVTVTGTPIREDLLLGNSRRGLEFCGFNNEKENLLIMGGSLGAKRINEEVRASLDVLQKEYNVIHHCGKGNIDESLTKREGYLQFEYLSEELKDLVALADIVVSRAGANSIFEFLALNKPNILIPLSKKQSRGDQILNAGSFEKKGYSLVLDDDTFTQKELMDAIRKVREDKSKFINNMMHSEIKNGTKNVMNVIIQNTK